MATFRKRGDAWRVEVHKLGIRKSATFDTKAQAREWASKIESDIRERKVNPAGYFTLRDAFERYREEVSPKRKGERWEAVRLRKLSTYPIAKLKVSEVTADEIARWRDSRLKEVKEASVRREMNLMASVFTRAIKEWGWLTVSPMTNVEKPRRSKPRDRRISDHEIECLLMALGYEEGTPVKYKDQLVALYFLFALETAMRLGEICKLRPGDYFREERYVLLRDSKNNDSRKVPLSTRAMELLEVIFDSGLTISTESASTRFRLARINTGIQDLVFHDTRHEALTRLAGKLSVLELARMVGHRDPKSLMIYYNATPLELASKLG